MRPALHRFLRSLGLRPARWQVEMLAIGDWPEHLVGGVGDLHGDACATCWALRKANPELGTKPE